MSTILKVNEDSIQIQMLFTSPEGNPVPPVLTVNVVDTTPIELTGNLLLVGGTDLGSVVSIDASSFEHLFNAKYEWYVDGELIPTATDSTYTPTQEQIGGLLEGKVIVDGLFCDTYTYTTDITEVCEHTIDVIDLRANLEYKWYLDEELVSETNAYQIKKSDAGKHLYVEVSGTNRYVGTLTSETVVVDKNERIISKPTVVSEDENHNITLSRSLSVGDGTVYYGSSYTGKVEDVSDWQTSRTFAPPTQNTVYYFAKVDETDSYDAAYSDVSVYEYTGPIFMPGDVNGDKKINTRDIIALSRYYADGCTTDPEGYNVTINELAADVNDDGRINTRDIIALSRYYVDGCTTDPDGYNVTLLPSKGLRE